MGKNSGANYKEAAYASWGIRFYLDNYPEIKRHWKWPQLIQEPGGPGAAIGYEKYSTLLPIILEFKS